MSQQERNSALAARIAVALNGRPRRAGAVANPASASAADVYATIVELLDALRRAGAIEAPEAPANMAPTAAFTSITAGLTATFTDASTDSDGTIVSRAWQFGDGGTSSATNPTHTYASAGTYTVTLTVTDNDGATDDVSHDVAVSEAAGPQITVTTNAMRYPEDDPYSATPTAPVPGTPQAGDEMLFIVAVTARGPVNWTGSGFEQIAEIGASGGDYMYVGRRVATGDEDGDIQVTLQDGAGDWFAMAVLVHGTGEYQSIAPNFVSVGNVTAGNPVPIAGATDVDAPAGCTALWLGSISTFGAASGTVSAVTLPSGFSEEGRIVDNVCETLLCASRVFDAGETGTYSGSATFTGADFFKTFAALVQFGTPTPTSGVVQNTGTRKFLPVTGTATLTPDTPFAEGNTVVVALGVYNAANVNLGSACNVTINGGTAACAIAGNNDGWGEAIFYGVAGSGSAGIEITFSPAPSGGGENYIVAGAIECNDLASSPLDQVATNVGTGTPSTVTTPTTTQARERIVAVVTTANNLVVPVTVDGSDTLIYQDIDGANEVPSTCAYRDVESTGAQTVTWANGGNGSNSWRMIAATFKRS